MANVVKRNGDIQKFNKNKIHDAIFEANSESEEEITKEAVEKICSSIEAYTQRADVTVITTAEISNLVENKLMNSQYKDTARKYIEYRHDADLIHEMNTTDKDIMSLIAGENEEWNSENSNKDAKLVTTQRDYIAGIVNKDVARRYIIPAPVMKAHDKGAIHIHDMDYILEPRTNCGLANLHDMLQNGTVMNDVLIEKPHRLSTATTVATQIIFSMSSSQYGGLSVSLSALAPFVDSSRQSYYKNYVENGVDEKTAKKLTDEDVKREISASMQTLQYQLNTLNTGCGQSPFITLWLYLGEAENEQEEKDLAALIEEVLKQRICSVKNPKGEYITIAFPKLILCLDKKIMAKKYTYLRKLAAQCTSMRLVPDYVSEKVMLEEKIDKNGNGGVFPPMGCLDYKHKVSINATDMSIGVLVSAFCQLRQKFADVIIFRDSDKQQLKLSLCTLKKTSNNISMYIKSTLITNNLLEWLKHPAHLEGDSTLINVKGLGIYIKSGGKNVPLLGILENRFCSNWMEIKYDGGTLKLTDDHPLVTYENGVVQAQYIKADDELMSVDNKPLFVKEVKRLDITGTSYDVTTESGYFDIDGIVYSHNCRSFLTPDYIEGNIAKAQDYDDTKGKYYGRFNIGVTTVNLAYVGFEAKKKNKDFFDVLDHYLNLAHKMQKIRAERVSKIQAKVAPILWCHGGYARLDPDETLDKLVHNHYATSSIGYTGLYEAVKSITGENFWESSKAHDTAVKILEHMNKMCDAWKKAENIDYSIYGTPNENGTYREALACKKAFGEDCFVKLDGHDREYITNSCHVPVFVDIDPFDKITKESELQKLSPGGNIVYIETADLHKNPEAIMEIQNHIYENSMYAEVNSVQSWCAKCKGKNTIRLVGEMGNYHPECKVCGNTDIYNDGSSLSVRVCGYISTSKFSQGRAGDIQNRVIHVDNKQI